MEHHARGCHRRGYRQCGRSLQDAKTITELVNGAHRGPALGALVLAVILSGAAIVFAARKSDAQSFVTVEDFWADC